MSVFIDSKAAVLNYLNTANGTPGQFTAANLVLSDPAPVAGTWLEGTTAKNTFMKVNADPSATFEGRATIKYDRLTLGDFTKFKATRGLPAYQPVTTKDLLPNILYYFGLFITAKDIIDEPVTLDGNGAGTVTLRANPKSPLWLGSLTFNVVLGGANISSLATVTALNGLNYPVPDGTTQTSALIYAYPLDFTAYRDSFLALAPGVLTDPQATTVMNALKAIDNNLGAALWNVTAANKLWSLQGATVIFSGLNSIAFPTNPAFKYVLCLELRADVTIPFGRFYLQYNDPDDPNSAG